MVNVRAVPETGAAVAPGDRSNVGETFVTLVPDGTLTLMLVLLNELALPRFGVTKVL